MKRNAHMHSRTLSDATTVINFCFAGKIEGKIFVQTRSNLKVRVWVDIELLLHPQNLSRALVQQYGQLEYLRLTEGTLPQHNYFLI